MKLFSTAFNIIFHLWLLLANAGGIPFSYKIYGIMVCRDSHWVLQAWLGMHASSFEKLVILDGSSEKIFNLSKGISQAYPNVIHVSETEASRTLNVSVHKTDNGLRGLAWTYLNSTEVLGNWVVIAHPDEFYPQKFVDLAKAADQEGHSGIRLTSVLAVPFKQEEQLLEAGIGLGFKCFNILHRITRYCAPLCCVSENRMFRYSSPEIRWGKKHSVVLPEVFSKLTLGTHHGFLLHFKIHDFDAHAIDPNTGRFANSAWSGLATYGKNGGFPDHNSANITNYSLLDPKSNPKTWLQEARERCKAYKVPCDLLTELEKRSLNSLSCSSS